MSEDLEAELRLVELVAIAARAYRALWTTAAQLVDERRITVPVVAKVTGVSERTAARRLAAARQSSPGRP
jgi:hypothetical protein